jgi:predicted nucleic acid-binding protein
MRRFFDTNVLVYLFDASVPRKKARAQELLKQAVGEGLALLSTQVLQEFFVAVTRKLSAPLPHEQAERAVRDLAKLPTAQVDAEMILKAPLSAFFLGQPHHSGRAAWRSHDSLHRGPSARPGHRNPFGRESIPSSEELTDCLRTALRRIFGAPRSKKQGFSEHIKGVQLR